MLYRISLKNTDKLLLLSDDAFQFINENPYHKEIKLLENLRLHSSGYAFYQKNYPTKEGKYKNVTIYIHKMLAEKFVTKPTTEKRLFVFIKNGNPLDCRTKNLSWVTMSELRRNQKNHNNQTGFRGVIQINKTTFRSVIYNKGERLDLGLFPSAEKAADAYNKKSEELFGKTGSLNRMK